jgi:excisionase family DNA binding protein
MTPQQLLVSDGVMDVRAAASLLGISRSKAYELMRDGGLPFIILGRRRLIPKRAVINLLVKHLHLKGGPQ